ncbi:MAG: tetratricopeptide repeat protein [Neisseriaceae bacterium]|nr:tetratricopeptide repeat protein [Neisseriaceae bacterium]MBP6861560.1 tetratricopeptide repeat protein [Neisseriaceae bacterium]
MAYDLQAHEEVEGFKRFWKNWGRWLFLALLIGAIAYVGNYVYQQKQMNKSADAAIVLDQLTKEVQASDLDKAKASLATLQNDYAKVSLTTQASLMMAGVYFDGGDFDGATKALTWVKDNHKDPLVQAITTERLAVVLLQQKKYDEAILMTKAKVEPEFEGLLLSVRGDIYAAQGKIAEAKEAYDLALAKTDEKAPGRAVIELKRNQQG